MLSVHVFVHVKPGMADAFLAATKKNALASIEEPGVARFDVCQQQDDENRFVLVEVYKDDGAPARHKETAHYAEWRDAVESMMAEPRTNTKYETRIPDSVDGWECP